ncbi:MAG: ferrochelatase, partial [Alphaproteobacteria bacterium]|nr:ferrochelatase [Alphaproteobacteria bacterium]
MKTAVVVFNLGGPDAPEAVRPFLFNLFNDPAIMRAPGPARWALAQLISRRRAPVARSIYAKIGGRSPILPETEKQAAALAAALAEPGETIRVFVAMRYWHPLAAEVAAEIAVFAPDRLVLLPLYPQFSTTTTGSFLRIWEDIATMRSVPTHRICCYPAEPGLIAAVAALTRAGFETARAAGTPRVIFSAHGLPKKFVADGDPYQHQVEATVASVVAAAGIAGLDHVIAYQSRVGPLEWIGPYTDAEIRRAGSERRPVVVVPVAFVSEHSETLVELDIEYGELAYEAGVPAYVRVPTVGTTALFIDGLARLVRGCLARPPGIADGAGSCFCPPGFAGCACRAKGAPAAPRAPGA